MGAPEIRSSNTVSENAVGPILRAGAIAEDNPDKEVSVVDRGDYVRIHTNGHCRLTQATLEKHLGRAYDLPMLEIEMPSFSGRL